MIKLSNSISAINMFLKRAIYERGIPFEIKEVVPSKEFLSSFKKIDYMENHLEEYKSFHSVKELMEDINTDN